MYGSSIGDGTNKKFQVNELSFLGFLSSIMGDGTIIKIYFHNIIFLWLGVIITFYNLDHKVQRRLFCDWRNGADLIFKMFL